MKGLTPHSPVSEFLKLTEEEFNALPLEAVEADGIRVVRLQGGNVLKLCRPSRRRGSSNRSRFRGETAPVAPQDEGQPLGPTPERLAKDEWVESGNGYAEKVSNPLRIDTLRRKRVISPMQHHYGIRFIALWFQAGRPAYRSALIMDELSRGGNGPEMALLLQLTRQEEYFKLISMLSDRHYKLLYAVCIDEETLERAAAQIRVGKNDAGVQLRDALDCLGDALEEMEEIKQAMERAG